VRRTPLAGSGSALLAEHGLAYHLESVRGPERREVLLDFSLTDLSLLHNYQALDVDPFRADALVISHGHRDHYGALPELARVSQGKVKPGLTLYAGGEDTFCHRVVVTPAGHTVDQGQLDLADLEARGLKVVLAKQPTVVVGHLTTTGQIPRITDFETPPASARLVGPMNSACSPTHFGTVKMEVKPGQLAVDNFQGEHATVGGFHLAPAPEETVATTVAAFKTIDPDYIIPAHCTGLNTIIAIQREMPRKLVTPSTGTRVMFGA